MLLIPLDGPFHTLFEHHFGLVAQFLAGWLDVTAPVALSQDVVFVIVQSRYLTCQATCVLTTEGYDAQHPLGHRQPDPPGTPQCFMDELAECSTLIDLSVREEVFPAVLSFLKGKEDVLHHVLHIDEGDVLLAIAHSKV